MVRVINFYYNNRTVQAVQELKNKPSKLLLVVKPLFVFMRYNVGITLKLNKMFASSEAFYFYYNTS